MEDVQIAIEIIITIAVVSIQLFFFYATYQKIKLLSELFPARKLDESFLQSSDTVNGTIELIKIDSRIFGKYFTEIITSINKYLLKNQGATDFSIIKSIVERSIETRESSVSANITLPLYIGLMGTFIGIIIGLLKIAFFGGVIDENINSFIGGVVIAMIASFFGLLLTVINNSKNFKNAKALCDERKNDFYSFLQVELLPHLGNSLFDALDKLKNNINDFNKKFETNINLFDSKFSVNIGSLSDSVQVLSGNIGAVVDNTKSQKEFLFELKKLGYNKLAESNVKVFKLINDTVPSLIEFVEKQKELNHLIGKTTDFVSIIENLFNRIKTFEDSINNLGENINSKHYLSGQIIERVDKNLNQLDKQFELLKDHEIHSSEAIEAYFTSQYNKIQELTDNIKREIETALDFNLQDNPFQKLLVLETLDKSMSEMNEKMNFKEDLKKIVVDLNFTKSEISEIKQKLGTAIENNKSKRFRSPSVVDMNTEDVKLKKKSLLKRITNLFRRKRGSNS